VITERRLRGERGCPSPRHPLELATRFQIPSELWV
jgi:hypothetical protein